jgi:hypothetical protein
LSDREEEEMMAVDERSRHELHQKLDDVLGTEAAATLMSHLPPLGWADVATKHDLAQLEARMNSRFQALEARFDARFEAVDSRFEAVDSRFEAMEARFDALDSKFDGFDIKLESSENALRAAFRGELNAAISAQTRTIVFALLGVFLSYGGFVLAATQLG